MIKNSIIDCIGNTPLVKIDEKIHGFKGLEVYAKCEFLNPFGSIKDRTALGLLRDAGDSKAIIESSSGNTAKALGILAEISGKEFVSVTNRIHYREIEDILRIIGMKIEMLPPGPECPDPNDPNSPFGVIQRIIAENPWKYFWTDQYTNPANPQIHESTTAQEIADDLGKIDYFFGGLGTTGSTMGVTKFFHNSGTKTIGIIAENRSFLPGIRNTDEMREVGLFDPELYADFETVNDQDAIDDMLDLIRKSGLLVGPTTGASFRGLKNFFKKQNPADLVGKKAVFIACDRLEPYTGYLREKRKSLFEDETRGEQNKFTPPLKEIEIMEKITENSGDIIVDMRSHISYEMGHIKGSINLPFEDLRKYLSHDYLPFPKESKIIFVCPFGEESQILANLANSLGYNASSLAGGFLNYKEKNPEQIV